ncbi:TIM22C [Auxenochlorella protothecoides x Auxenochlorella symbiontica]
MASRNRKEGSAEEPVLSLQLDSSTAGLEPREVDGDSIGGFQTPCTLKGLSAGASGGALGFVFGFGGYWFSQRLKGNLRGSLAEGWGSAKTFAIMGGLYAAVGCFMQRLRQREDAWNGAASGCATGLALGWANGPLGALQSCAMLGAFSYFMDGMAKVPPAAAAQRTAGGRGHDGDWAQTPEEQRLASFLAAPFLHPGRARSTLQAVLSPALPLAVILAPCHPAFGGCRRGGPAV